jgi:TonB family protein
MRAHLLRRVLPFVLTLLVGVALGSLLKHGRRHHDAHPCYGGVYQGGEVMTAPAPGVGVLQKVSSAAVILDKPDPLYTDEARRHGTAGEVRLCVLMSASGQVTEIEPLMTLPDGLTESAVEAARRIEFVPAQEHGQPIAQYVVISYRFDVQ